MSSEMEWKGRGGTGEKQGLMEGEAEDDWEEVVVTSSGTRVRPSIRCYASDNTGLIQHTCIEEEETVVHSTAYHSTRSSVRNRPRLPPLLRPPHIQRQVFAQDESRESREWDVRSREEVVGLVEGR